MKYFNINELCASTTATQRNINNTPTPQVVSALEKLIDKVLDPAREAFGAPIKVNSGYRSPDLNKVLNGATTSQHIKGEAADITTGTKEGNKRLFEIIRKSCDFDQLINEHDYSWIHVSYREGRNRKEVLNLG